MRKFCELEEGLCCVRVSFPPKHVTHHHHTQNCSALSERDHVKKNNYSIVVGTFKYRNNAEKQIKLIKSKYPVSTKDKISNVVLIKVSGKQLYESRFENFSKKEAYTACKRLKKYNRDCFVRL